MKFTTRQTAKVFPKKTNVFGGCCCRRRNPLPSLLKDKHGSMTRFVTWYTPKHPVAMSETKASANGSFIRRDGYLSFCCHEFLLVLLIRRLKKFGQLILLKKNLTHHHSRSDRLRFPSEKTPSESSFQTVL